MKFRTKSLLAVLLAVLMGAFSIAPASAQPPDESGAVTRFIAEVGLVFGDDGVVALGGPSFEEGCLGEGFLPVLVSRVERGNGTIFEHYTSEATQLQLFEGDDPFAIIGAACGALFDGDPTTDPPEPIAVGTASYNFRATITDGVAEIHDSLNGQVTFTNGRTAHVRASDWYIVDGGQITRIAQRVHVSG